MKTFLKAVFQPVANRHYTNNKISALNYASNYIPALLISLFGGFAVDKVFFLFFVALIIYGVVDYIVFDAFLDKLSWNLFWSRFYKASNTVNPQDYDLIKQIDKDPNANNYQALENEINKKQ